MFAFQNSQWRPPGGNQDSANAAKASHTITSFFPQPQESQVQPQQTGQPMFYYDYGNYNNRINHINPIMFRGRTRKPFTFYQNNPQLNSQDLYQQDFKSALDMLNQNVETIATEIVRQNTTNQITRQKKLKSKNRSIFAEAQVMGKDKVQVEDNQQDDAEAEAHISEIINSSENDEEPAVPVVTDIWQKADFWNNKPTKTPSQPVAEVKEKKNSAEGEKPKPAAEEKKETPAEPVEDSDYMKAWKALPRNKKDKLTKKQQARIDKPDTLFDSLVTEVKQTKKGKMIVVANESVLPEVPRQPKEQEKQIDRAKQPISKFNEEPQFHNFVRKRKPKQIMVETKDWETGEIVKQLVDKVRRHKVTRLKKAILQSRKKLKTPGHKSASNTSFETIQEEDLVTENEEGLFVLQEEPIERPKEYVNVFGDLNKICNDIIGQITKTSLLGEQMVDSITQSKYKPGKAREYVDVKLGKNLDDLTVNLIMKLKELFYRRKLKVPKNKKDKRPAKKRYIIGLNEVQKHLQAGNLTMVILAINMEKVDESFGIDQIVQEISETCRKSKVPLVFSMSRYRLGCATKYKGQTVSACGIMNYQSANDEFNILISAIDQAREQFYTDLVNQHSANELILMMRTNPFINWSHTLVRQKMVSNQC